VPAQLVPIGSGSKLLTFFDTGRPRAGVEGTVQSRCNAESEERGVTSQLGERRAKNAERIEERGAGSVERISTRLLQFRVRHDARRGSRRLCRQSDFKIWLVNPGRRSVTRLPWANIVRPYRTFSVCCAEASSGTLWGGQSGRPAFAHKQLRPGKQSGGPASLGSFRRRWEAMAGQAGAASKVCGSGAE
jgi:hypothetical protein